MVALKNLLLVPLVAAAALERRADNAAEVNQSITNIDVAERNLTSILNNYHGGILGVNPILEAFNQIHYVNRQGFFAATSSTNFTSPESQKIARNVNDSVGVSIPINTQTLMNKKSLFEAAELAEVIGEFINKIRFDHETISAAIGLHLTPDALPLAGAGAAKIEAAFLAASAFYADNEVPVKA